MTTTAAGITAALQQWRAESYVEQSRKMNISYIFSEQWQQAVNKLWEAYSELENQRRKIIGAARLSWQDQFEAEHSSNLALRKSWFKPFPERLWRICPLWVCVARYQGRPEQEDDRRLHGWRSLLDDWKQMSELMETDDDSFRHALSPTQQRSYHLLRRWWTATYCSRGLVDATKIYLERQTSVHTLDDPATAQRLVSIATDIQTDTSMYHAKLFLLLLLEFHPRCWEPNAWRICLITLQTARYESSCLATMQQMAYTVLHSTTTRQVPYPTVVKNDDVSQRMTWTPTGDKPYYLWDSKRDETVVVQHLAMCPEYVCISHTWGRWPTRTKTNIPGVPWAVPENRIFDVKSLPEQLHQVGQRYIWFDLLCIPQDRSLRGSKEIANQASIFKGSSSCIAWINDVNSWDGVIKALDWISLSVWSVISCGGKELVRDRLLDATSSAAVPMELIKRRQVSPDNVVGPSEPANWFSSLWTLQECALCPDIELYSRTWQRLEDRCGAAISLRTLMVLCFETKSLLARPIDNSSRHWYSRGMGASDASVQSPQYPSSVHDIYELSSLTRLDEVLTDGSPIPVLVHSNKRHSTSSRAPAIMSAIGVTDWYLQSIVNKTKEPLLYDKYPISFVREAAAKLGAQFYNCTGTLHRPRKISMLLPSTTRTELQGGMLPFAKSEGWFDNKNGMYNSAFIDRTDHEAVSTWTINEHGGVTMRSVGISMTSHDEPAAQPASGLVQCVAATDGGREAKTSGEALGTNDMLATLKSMQYGARCIYAVALYEDSCILHGVLLEHLPVAVLNGQYLIKIGLFVMKEAPLPPSRDVHWEVM